eukprot:TRINITY_DN2815_c0_g1_i1.p1 TRINITY_DN2815_c0_g1~~TRINITY_DN2815_c0_g1_i1.p1  ORF type:complete len:839 (+),score=313.35 TRINITY_DN2815_c0_g1_i1:77-2593(+)
MVRIQFKGGVWKNTEDEVLKAAVMKYGKNQWSRISSLLVRKSAKQCKARWYEWLDPSIKKTEWGRDEEEKLLHLAKIMPCQWKTIAPMIGRTAAQCLEHYEKLLDTAQEKEGEGKDTKKEAKDDPRRLRPGEVDPLPEAKPPRPDTVDMDEDEKEMLSEARARLSNVKGKKAKRKAREKQLEQARRLTVLQKKRELKAAGIEIRMRKRKKKYGIDYAVEIPFQKLPSSGFFDTGSEKQLTTQVKKDSEKSFIGQDLQTLDGNRRDDVEEKQRIKDEKRLKLQKEINLPLVIQHASKMSDPEQFRKRTKLNLPAPQITESQIEELSKGLSASSSLASSSLSGHSATKSLLSQTPSRTPFNAPSSASSTSATPIRTPRRQDTLMMEAQNLIALTAQQTPLKGGENTPLHPTDFTSMTPKKSTLQTPNVLMTPSRVGLGSTPARDELKINTPSSSSSSLADPNAMDLSFSSSSSAAAALKASKRKELLAKRRVKNSLSSLPTPTNEYTLVLPDIRDEQLDASKKESKVEDAEDILMRQRKEAARKAQEDFKKRSQVVQRGLPRPKAINIQLEKEYMSSEAETEVAHEMLRIMRYDDAVFPVVSSDAKQRAAAALLSKNKRIPSGWIDFTLNELDQARSLISTELEKNPTEEEKQLRETLGTNQEKAKEESSMLAQLWRATNEQLLYLPTRRQYDWMSTATSEEKLQALQQQFALLKEHFQNEHKLEQKLEKNVEILTTGYRNRSGLLLSQVQEQFGNLSESLKDLQCFRVLESQENNAMPARLTDLNTEVKKLTEQERTLQQKYASLLSEQQSLHALLNKGSSTSTSSSSTYTSFVKGPSL